MLEEYSDEEIGIMVIALGTFIHREAAIAAPFLPEILSTVTKCEYSSTLPEQSLNLIDFPTDTPCMQRSLGSSSIQQTTCREDHNP